MRLIEQVADMEHLGLAEKVQAADWDCVTADTHYLTHGIHRYSGKFIPQIARQAIELLTKPGDLVLDPYCGSGTTLLECALMGRNAIGLDLNPLAVLVSHVKTSRVERELLDAFVRRVEEEVRAGCQRQLSFDLFNGGMLRSGETVERVHEDPRWQDSWYVKWFNEDVRLELIGIHRVIAAEPVEQLRNIGLVAFSDILRKSSNAHSSYPNVMFDKNKKMVPPATPRFIERLRQVVQAVSELEWPLAEQPQPRVLRGNARAVPIADASVAAVVTHPPYIASIPYAEYGYLSLRWLGYDPNWLDRELTGGRRHSRDVVERFVVGFGEMIREAWRVLKPGGRLFMLVGSPLVKGRRIELSEMARELASAHGFEVEAVAERNGINRRANLMGHETLLFFRKLGH